MCEKCLPEPNVANSFRIGLLKLQRFNGQRHSPPLVNYSTLDSLFDFVNYYAHNKCPILKWNP